MKNCVLKMCGVESMGNSERVGSTSLAAAIDGLAIRRSTREGRRETHALRSQTTSKSWKLTSSMRAKILSTVSAEPLVVWRLLLNPRGLTERLGDEPVWRSLGCILAAEHEVYARSTGAQRERGRTGEVDATHIL